MTAPRFVSPPEPEILPLIVVLPVPAVVRRNPPLATLPATVKAPLPLLVQVWGPARATAALIVWFTLLESLMPTLPTPWALRDSVLPAPMVTAELPAKFKLLIVVSAPSVVVRFCGAGDVAEEK